MTFNPISYIYNKQIKYMGKGGKVKKGNGNNRGYIGYHVTWDNKKVFLRSKAEFIYARKLDYERTPYLLEVTIYEIDGIKYKPDFFIFTNEYSKIIEIVEVKGLDDKKTALQYLESYKDYFSSLNIGYSVVWKQMATIKKYKLTEEIKQWIKTSIEYYDNVSDVSGENNPMYRLKHSDETKKLISDKAKERCGDIEYLEMMSDVQSEYWNSGDGLVMRKKASVRRKEHIEKTNPIIICECKNCNGKFEKRQNIKKEYCSGKCKRIWLHKNDETYGKHKKTTSFSNQLKTYIGKILSHYNIDFKNYIENFTEITQKAKINGVIPKNKGITLETLKKYNII